MHSLARFKDAHAGGCIVVCACGESLNSLTDPEGFITIGVNDVGRKFDPTYLVVVDPREAFKGDRFHYVETSRAKYLFTQRTDLAIPHPNVVRFRLGAKDGTDFRDPDVLNYSVTTPYVALCLAIHMGAANIGLIGVDFTPNHFFGATGPHGWSPHVDTIDAQFDRLCRAAAALGVRVFNLSPQSRVTAIPKMTIETFATLPAGPTRRDPPVRVVSYATTPIAGVPAILARCINARTRDLARCVWAADGYGNGTSWTGDICWSGVPGSMPAKAMAELEAADVVVVHNGKIDERHRAVLADKPVITMAHNYLWNVDDRLVRQGFPGLVVGQYQATLPEFRNWSIVPNPIAVWEEAGAFAARGEKLTIAFTPSGKHDSYPPEHQLYWHAKGYRRTVDILDRLALKYPIRLEVIRDRFVPHSEAMAMKRRAHILIDECVTGSYHRNSLEGLAAGCVVINGVGLRPGVAEALQQCAGAEAGNPFISADLASLEPILETLIGLGPDLLANIGGTNRAWMERHWDFASQWDRFWRPAVDQAIQVASDRRAARCVRRSRPRPEASVVIASRNEGDFLHHTVDCFAARIPASWEIVVVDDGSTDGSADFLEARRDRVVLVRAPAPLGTGRARNLGARHANGRIVVFSDAHVAAPPDWGASVTAALADPDVGAVGPAIHAMRFPGEYGPASPCSDLGPRGFGMKWKDAGLRTAWLKEQLPNPYDVPLLNGAFIAMRRSVFASIGGFDPGMGAGGAEDAELSLRLWRLGYRCLVLPSLAIAHHFRTDRPYPLGWEPVLYNTLRLATLHFAEDRQRCVLDTMRGHDVVAKVLARLQSDGTATRREHLRAFCPYDDDWFFDHFRALSMPDLLLTPFRSEPPTARRLAQQAAA